MADNLVSSGQIITFYSYKGGTGRSMALANVACLLARETINKNVSPKVLMIDWDLEAPGLHRFFQNKVTERKSGNKHVDFRSKLGLIDLFYTMRENCVNIGNEISDDFFDNLALDEYILETEVPSLYLMTAGKFDDNYSARANSFDWANLFETCPSLLLRFSEYLSKKFSYVLVDSRTGYTDISGICTTLIPEKLVLVFTPNHQSLTGIIDLVRKATEYRKQSDDLRKLIVFPLPSRIESAEPNLRKDWRFGNPNKDIYGYQPEFQSVFKDVYRLKECDLTRYFDEVQIQQIPRYAYGEEIAVLSERTEDRLSIARSYEDFTQRLTLFEGPWDYPRESIEIGGDVVEGSKIVGNENVVRNKIETKGLLRVFLAHSSFDKPLVRKLYQKLSSEDWIDPWLDEDRLLPGQDWSREISKAVRESDVLVVCLSEKAVEKEGYIQKELKYALDATLEKPEGEIFIIPIRFDNCKVPSRLMSYHWLDYFPENERLRSYNRLLDALQMRAVALGKETQNKFTDDFLRRIKREIEAEGESQAQISNRSLKTLRELAKRIAQRLDVSIEEVIDAIRILGGKT